MQVITEADWTIDLASHGGIIGMRARGHNIVSLGTGQLVSLRTSGNILNGF